MRNWCKLQDKLYIALLAAPSVNNVNVLTVAQQNPNGGWLNRVLANDSSSCSRMTQLVPQTVVLGFHLQTEPAHQKLFQTAVSLFVHKSNVWRETRQAS